MEDPKKNPGRQNPGAEGPQGIGVPAKGDSSPESSPPGSDGWRDYFRCSLEASHKAPIQPPAKTPSPPSLASQIPISLWPKVCRARVPLPRSFSGADVPEIILNPGDVIGARYELLDMLGEGGMGAVFKAHDLEIDRFVAKK